MEELSAWLALKSLPGIGNHLRKRLIDRFKTPEAVFAAVDSALSQVEGMTARHIETIRGGPPPVEAAERELEKAKKIGCRLLPLTDPDYPALLREIPDPPILLYVKGSIEALAPAVAVVGTRNPSRYGIRAAMELSMDLVSRGITVVSGLARGVDTAAHEGAMRQGGKTAAVLGCGFHHVYPPENRALYRRIAKQGALITEFALDEPPDSYHFPVRNRIISGITLGCVVVEAARRSGALITARLAAEQNREVFAVPGSIHSAKSAGPNRLIRNGATLVESAADIFAELPRHALGELADRLPPPVPEQPPLPVLSETEQKVADALTDTPQPVDALVRKTEMEPGILIGQLLTLELKGVCRQLPGKHFVRETPAYI